MIFMSDEETIGFHKGSLTTLAKEREELIRILTIVEQLMQAHLKSLKELGIDLEKEAKEANDLMKKTKTPKKKGENITDRLA